MSEIVKGVDDLDTWVDKMNPAIKSQSNVINVKEVYGAVGDDSTDDTTAIQTALTAAQADSSISLYFPKGTYKITSTLTFAPTYDGAVITGDMEYRSIIKQYTANQGGLAVTFSTNRDGFVLSNLDFRGTNNLPGGDGLSSTGTGVSFIGHSSNLDRLTMEHVRITGFETGLVLTDVAQSQIRNCWIGYNLLGIDSSGNNNALQFSGGAINGNITGVEASGGRGLSFINMDLGGSDCTRAITFTSTASVVAKIDGCNFEWYTSGLYIIESQNASNKITVQNCHFQGNAVETYPVYMSSNSTLYIENVRASNFSSASTLVYTNQSNSDIFGTTFQSRNAGSTDVNRVKRNISGDIQYQAITPFLWEDRLAASQESSGTRGQIRWDYDSKGGATPSVHDDRLYAVYRQAGDTYAISDLINDKGFFDANVTAQPSDIVDTSGANLATLEGEVNALKALLRTWGLMG